jgi:Zn-dependent protease with chaperone function
LRLTGADPERFVLHLSPRPPRIPFPGFFRYNLRYPLRCERTPMNALKLICLLVLFPLLLVAGGGWQLQRAVNGALEVDRFNAGLAAAKPQLQAIAAQNPVAIVDLGSEKVGVQLALSRLEKVEGEIGTAHTVNRLLQVLAKWAIGVGLLAALIGIAALAGTHWAGTRAQQSREKLLQVFSLGSRLLPYVLVSQVVAIAATVALVLSYEGLAMWHIGRMSSGEFKMMMVAALIAAVCLYSIWLLLRQLRSMLAMFEPTPIPMFGRVVTAHQAPGLWRHVGELATRLDALPPDHIVISLAEGFYVTSSDAVVLPAETALRGRTLHVPLLYLGLLSREEIGAVIGHELAHFVGEDTEYSMRFLPIYDGVSRSLGALAISMLASDAIQARLMRPSFLFGIFFLERFDHAVNHWSRERELLADAAGARLAGNAAAASALVRVSAIAPQVDSLLRTHLGIALGPTDSRQAAEDLPGAMIHELQQCELQLPPEALDVHLPHPTDSHPSNGERLAALQVAPETAIHSGTRAVDAQAAYASLGGYFAEPVMLRQQLTQDLISQAVSHDTAYAEALISQIEAVTGEQRLHEGGRVRGMIISGMGVTFLAVGLLVACLPWLSPRTTETTSLMLITGAIVAGVALLLVWFGVRLVKRAPQTALGLTPEHFVFANLAQPLPIQHIADVALQVGHGTLVTVTLTPDAPLPELRKSAFGVPGVKVNKKRRLLLLQVVQLCIDNQRLKPQAALELMIDYLNAAQARQILQQRQG